LTWGTGKLPTDWQKPDLSSATWSTGLLPNREGIYAFIVAIMAPHDPARREREDRKHGYQEGTKRARDLRNASIEVAREQVLSAIAAHEPATFNEVCVRLLDLNAVDCTGGNYEAALWGLVETGAIEHTMEAPIYFRRTSCPSSSSTNEKRSSRQSKKRPPAKATDAR
jgi:hypothetical protein